MGQTALFAQRQRQHRGTLDAVMRVILLDLDKATRIVKNSQEDINGTEFDHLLYLLCLLSYPYHASHLPPPTSCCTSDIAQNKPDALHFLLIPVAVVESG